jgi:hypothetical protein
MDAWLHILGQNIMAVGICGKGTSHLMAERKQKAKEGPSKTCPKRHTLSS